MQEKEYVAIDRRKLIVLVIYDITNTKKRNAMVKCLEKYAVRVQKSCFEGFLTQAQCIKMEAEASQIIDVATDSLRVYILQDHTRVKSWGQGIVQPDDVIIY